MKVLFVIHDLSFADHMAVAYLSAIAKQSGHQTDFCLLGRDDLCQFVERLEPDVVGYSVNVIGYKAVIEAHGQARRIHSFVSIMGGPQATFSPETFNESGMDAYCIGEGEYAFRDFLQKVEQGQPFDDIANIITKRKSNAVRPAIRNLDELPIPDRDLVISNSHLKDVAKKTFYATRGCPFMCSYCCNNYYHQLYKGKGPIVRRFSVERVIQEIEYVKSKYRMDFLKFGDDLFASRADDWLREFSLKYAERIKIPFNCYLRIDTIDEELLQLLKNAGCFSVHLSVDSVSAHVREKVLNRKMLKVDILEKLKLVSKFGINTWCNYMLAAPESTLQDDLDTITWSKQAKITYPSYSTTVPMKGTTLYDYCIEHKFIDKDTYKGDMTGCLQQSRLLCFSDKEKQIRYNIFLLGAVISKLPFPLDKMAIWLIKVIAPNRFFEKIREWFYDYSITHTIFKIPKGG
jgi:radical SAM superfamily enzyme YgiQ (UPF0313 family)